MNLVTQKVYTAFFRELKTFYKLEDLQNLLKSPDSDEPISLEHAEEILTKLQKENVVRKCTRKQFNLNELNEDELAEKEAEDPTILNDKEKGYYFNFVGVAYVDDCVIKVYPKYIDLGKDKVSTPYDYNNADAEDKIALEKHFSTVLRVLKKVNSKTQGSSLNDLTKNNFNRIGMQIYLLEDYYRNGLYSNLETIVETNGEGEIDWDKTINETTAIIKSKKPYYVELQTINTRSNEFDYFKMLHESILCQCSKTLRESELLKYLGMIPCELTGMPLSTFGDDNYVKYRLNQEIRTQFVTRKKNQLISLLTYIEEDKVNKHSDSVKLFGSNKFENEWEAVCKGVFDDLYKNHFRFDKTMLEDSPSIGQLIENDYLSDETHPDNPRTSDSLRDLIERVDWNIDDSHCDPDGNLTPDIISIYNQHNFYLLDAKYYLLSVDKDKKSIRNNPGVQDVLKQFAYEKAYHDFLNDYAFFNTINAFVMPVLYSERKKEDGSEDIFTYNNEQVSWGLMQNYSYQTLGPIQVIKVNPDKLFNAFLHEQTLLSELTDIFERKGILNPIRRATTNDGSDFGLTMVGFIRKEYMNQIKKKPSFTFYFYCSKDERQLEIHPELLKCSKFIGYCYDEVKVKLQGTVVPEIRRVSSEELRQLLSDKGIKKETSGADWYYCITIEDLSFSEFSDDEYKQLGEKIRNSRGNHLIHKFSPKVI